MLIVVLPRLLPDRSEGVNSRVNDARVIDGASVTMYGSEGAALPGTATTQLISCKIIERKYNVQPDKHYFRTQVLIHLCLFF